MTKLETKQITINGRKLIVNADDPRANKCDSLIVKEKAPVAQKRAKVKKQSSLSD